MNRAVRALSSAADVGSVVRIGLAAMRPQPAADAGAVAIAVEPEPAPVHEAAAEPALLEIVSAPPGGSSHLRRRPPLISPSTKRWLLQGVVLLCLLPVTVLLGLRLTRLTHDPIIGIYGVLVLFTTAQVMYVAFAHYRDSSHHVENLTYQPFVSCLVACKDDADVIERCVRSMLEQTYTQLEVIAVDDGSTDGSLERLQALADDPELGGRFRLLVNEKSVGKKRALVRGVQHARGAFFIFTDSDCILDLGAVEQVMRAFESDPTIGAVSGDARALNADHNVLTRMQDTWYDGQFSIWKATESVFGSVSCISGPLAAFRREAIYNYFPAWAADTFLGQEFRFATDRQLTAYVLGQEWVGEKLKKKHRHSPMVHSVDYPPQRWRIEYVKSAMVWTNVPPSMKSLFRQQTRWKKSFLRNLCFTGTFYWRRGPAPSLLFYPHALFVLATPIMAFRHLIWLPAHGAFTLSLLYLAGVTLKGSMWAIAYRIQNPGCSRWVYRPLMSLLAALCFSMLLLWSMLTVRKQAWVRD